MLLKGTHGGVDGVYTSDPRTDPDRRSDLDEVTFDEVIAKELRAMDLTAITLCKENALPICVFDLWRPATSVAPSPASRSVRWSS